MPSPYELRTRWLEWHTLPVDKLESLTKQIDCVKREIARRETVRKFIEQSNVPAWMEPLIDCNDKSIAEMTEVLATLERLLPPF